MEFSPKDQVVFTPVDWNGDFNDPRLRQGFVSSKSPFRYDMYYIRFFRSGTNEIENRTVAELCPSSRLVLHVHRPQRLIDFHYSYFYDLISDYLSS